MLPSLLHHSNSSLSVLNAVNSLELVMKVFRGLFLMADLDNDIPAFWRVFFIYMDFLKWFLLCHGKDAVTIHSYGDLWGVQAYLLFTELTSVSFFLRMSHTFDLATYNIPIVSMMFFFFFFWSLKMVWFLNRELLWLHIVGFIATASKYIMPLEL